MATILKGFIILFTTGLLAILTMLLGNAYIDYKEGKDD
jgi:1,4-dihydroxy-2-naphthoate octaprenyltransferase